MTGQEVKKSSRVVIWGGEGITVPYRGVELFPTKNDYDFTKVPKKGAIAARTGLPSQNL